MTGFPTRRWLLAFAAVLLLAAPVAACPFCGGQGKTLTGEVAEASLVLFGTLENASEPKSTTDLRIESIIKDNEVRGDKKVITLPRLPAEQRQERRAT